jgi:hypothetical protein
MVGEDVLHNYAARPGVVPKSFIQIFLGYLGTDSKHRDSLLTP